METREKRTSLKRRINRVELLMMILMAVAISLVSSYAMRNAAFRFYNEKGLDIVRILAAQVDGDRLRECLASEDVTGQAYYQELHHMLDVTKSNITNESFLYMYIPGEDSWVYVMEGQTPWDDPALISHYGDVYQYGETEYTRMLPDAKAKKPSTEIVLGVDTGYGLPMSNWAPVLDGNGDLVAMIEIDYNLKAIREETIGFISKLVLAFVACIALVLFIVLRTIRRYVTAPLENLTAFVDSYEHGVLNEEKIADFKYGDEIQWLATSFRDMTLRIESYIRDLTAVTAEKERIKMELSLAANIQASMLPKDFDIYKDHRGFTLFASMRPAKEVGGDFYDFFLIDDTHLALVMADVSGKGVPAALFMAKAKTSLKMRAVMGGTPSEILADVNVQMCEGNDEELFVTIWLAIIDLKTGKGLAANAGHEHPALCRAGGRYELIKYRHSIMVAAFEGARFKQHEFELRPGDSLFVYTDGVPEATTNEENKFFGEDRLVEALNKNPDAMPEEVLKTMSEAINKFAAGAEQFDDITMLCLKYNGAEDANG